MKIKNILSRHCEVRSNPGKINQLSKKPFGFTLVELIVVITILVILGTIAFINLGGFASSARDGRRVSDMSNITQSIELSVVTQGSAPIPTDAKSYAGGNITVQMGTITNATIPKMSGDFSDPITKAPYNYSVFGNGLYYQIGIDFENPLSYHIGIPGIETVYADNGVKYSKLSGSYKFDPSLPSLFPIGDVATISSHTGGLFSPDTCFVMSNVSTNTFGSTASGCLAKKNINLRDMDSSLVGYWDMETCTGTGGICGTDDKLRDLSGNGNDAVGAFSLGNTGALISKGTYFDGNSWITANLPDSENISYEIIMNSMNSPGLRTLGGKIGTGTTTDCLYCLREAPQGIFLDGNFSTGSIYDTGSFVRKTGGKTDKNYLNSYHIFGITYDGNNYKIYKDGVLFESFYVGLKLVASDGKYYIGRGMGYYNFLGIIDDIKIYNRALSDDEIKQQAKIAGF